MKRYIAGFIFLTAPYLTHAQFTSSYTYVNLAANFNSYETFTPNMQLISNGLWQTYVTLTNYSSTEFLFATTNFSTTWKETNQVDFEVNMTGTAETNSSGSNISITGTVSGTFKFLFNEQTLAYSVTRVTTPQTGTNIWINEIDYSHPGTDSNEWIELMGTAGLSITNYELLYFSGSSTSPYRTDSFTNNFTFQDEFNGFGAFVVGRTPDSDQDFRPTNWNSNVIQNDNESILLRRKSSSTTNHFVGYDGNNSLGENDITSLEDSDDINSSLYKTGGPGTNYNNFSWTNIENVATPGYMNPGQSFPTGTISSLSISNLTTNPSVPSSNDAVHIEVDISSVNGASNLSATLFYRVGTLGLFSPIGMTNAGTHYATTNPIAAQIAGSVVYYYIFVNFDGYGTNSPTTYPSSPQSYSISRLPRGSVWINEINVNKAGFNNDTNEFIELAGVAGIDLSEWSIALFDSISNNYANYTISNNTVLVNDSSGFGFYIFGDSNVSNVDRIFNHTPFSTYDHLPQNGGIKLFDEVGIEQYAICYGIITLNGFTNVGTETSGFTDTSLALTGTGSNYNSFAWVTNTSLTPGTANTSQTFTGGNTNPIPPSMTCPDDLVLECVADIPAADTNEISALEYCASSSDIFLTHVGDVTNTGTGCASSPIVITRTYQAVDGCGQTSVCVQTIAVMDTNAPSLSVQQPGNLSNGGFETGTFANWNTFGSNTVLSTSPHAGTFHARISGQSNGFENFNGFYQDVSASSGQVWRAAVYMMSPTNSPVSGNNRAELKLEYLNGSSTIIQTHTSTLFTASMVSGVYHPIIVTGAAPANTASARLTALYVQTNNAGGSVYLDDASLSLTILSADTNCQATASDFTKFVSASGESCSVISTNQNPAAGAALDTGTNLIIVTARDACLNSVSCTFTVVVVDVTAPTIICPSDVNITTTNDIPAVDTESIPAIDNCGFYSISHVADTNNGGSGSFGDPRIIYRRYRATDDVGNSSDCIQTITVESTSVPPDVEVQSFTLGTNITVRVTGTNAWTPAAEFTTNLLALPQVWTPISVYSNAYANGTNVLIFNLPTGNTVIIRIQTTED